ncbi:MAG: hypothetical protein ACE5M4_11040, partial [Anaerolineales bacterium]
SKLGTETQSLLLFAAVIGRVFEYPTLRKVAEKDEDTLIDCLEDALRAQLIEELPETGGEGFRFSHALIPFSLREGISGLRRSRLHRKVAEVLEEISPGEFERLAHHWGEAGSDEKGLDYTIKAARRAQESYANQEAVHLYTEALSLLPDEHPKRYEMLAGRAQVYRVIGEYDKQREDAQAMLSIAERNHNPDLKMDALLELAENSLVLDVSRVSDYAENVISLAKPAGDPGRLGRAYFQLGQQNWQMFDRSKAQEHFDTAAPLLKEAGLMKEAADNLSYLSVALADVDREAALQAAKSALEIGKTTDDKLLEAITTRRVALALNSNYRFEEALEVSHEAIDLFRAIGDREGEVYALNANAIIHRSLGDIELAERGYMEMLELAEEIGSDTGQRWAVNNLMVMYNFGTGEYEKGLKLAEAQVEKARQQSNELVLFSHMGDIQGQLYRMGQYQAALDIMLDHRAEMEEYLGLSFRINVQFYLSELHYRLGHEIEGKRYFTEGEGLLKENEFLPIQEFYIWDSILAVNLVHPGASPFTEIIENMEALIQGFRKGSLLQVLAEALYSISQAHLALAVEAPAHIQGALTLLQEAEEITKTIQPDLHVIEHQLYLHARAHRLASQDEPADDYLKQAHDWLMACAGRITTPEYRQSYLENIPDNHAIQEAYEDRFGTD